MLGIWGLCLLTYVILPYQLLERQLTVQGMVILAVFIAAFLVGTLMVPRRKEVSSIEKSSHIDASKAEVYLTVASGFATIFFVLDIWDKNLFDLSVAYELRSQTADALLKGEASASSVWFQIAFLFYPAGYVFTVVHALYARRVQVWKLVIFGLLPVILATIGMGGRNPIFYGVIVAFLALGERKKMVGVGRYTSRSGSHKWIVRLIWLMVLIGLFQYFASVFMIRAAAAGGSTEMFMVAEERWGVGFHGPTADVIFALFGDDISYLIFIFVWYLVQGIVMSNYLFSAYDGPLQFGVYGVDMMSALVRRLDPEGVAEGFDSLLNLGTYGFFPSAWGSLYVDFGFAAIIICTLWGMFTALCYRRIVVQKKTDWMLIGPFASIGIIFSLINTPLGFSNGFVTHGWLLVAFLSLKRGKCLTQEPQA